MTLKAKLLNEYRKAYREWLLLECKRNTELLGSREIDIVTNMQQEQSALMALIERCLNNREHYLLAGIREQEESELNWKPKPSAGKWIAGNHKQ